MNADKTRKQYHDCANDTPQSNKDKTVYVFVRKLPFDVKNDEIYPPERQAEITSVTDVKLKTQKYYVWKLLEYALKRCCGADVKSAALEKQNGKWTCNKCNFSMSHCNDVVAVALSQSAVGVDVEKTDVNRFSDALARKICTKKELAALPDEPVERASALAAMWTVKESFFKSGKDAVFAPSRIETSEIFHVTKQLRDGDAQYVLSVVSRTDADAVFDVAGLELL